MKKNTKMFLLALATLIGTIIGAGFLGIPKALTISGFMPGIVMMVLVSFFMFIMCLFTTELTLNTKKVYQMPGMVKKYLGKKMGTFASIIFALISVGAIIAYLLGCSQIISNFTGIDQTVCMLIYFAIIFVFVFKGLDSIKQAEFYIEIALFVFLALIAIFLRGDFDINNIPMEYGGDWIIPFGVILFSFGGYNVMSHVELITKSDKNLMVKTSFYGMLLAFAFFVTFSVLMLGVYGGNVSDIATESLTGTVGIVGNLIALFAMTGSFIMSGLLLKDMLVNDYNLNKNLSSFVSMFTPLILLFVLGTSFMEVLSFTGAVVAGMLGVIICITVIVHRRKIKKVYFKTPGGIILPIITALFFLTGILVTLL